MPQPGGVYHPGYSGQSQPYAGHNHPHTVQPGTGYSQPVPGYAQPAGFGYGGAVVQPAGSGFYGYPYPLWANPFQNPPEKAAEEGQSALSVKRFLQLLLGGLLPVIGVLFSMMWAFSGHFKPEERSLAKALLILHGGALVVLLCGLCIWVIGLAGANHALAAWLYAW